MKLLPPEKYDGETDFERFAKLLNAYMDCQDNIYHGMLEAATRKGAVPFTSEDMTAFAAENGQ